MSTQTIIPADVIMRMQNAVDRATKGLRDPADMRRAREELNRLREDLRKEIGTVDMAVDLIRDARNQ